MSEVDHLWAGWRADYISDSKPRSGCVFCGLLASSLPLSETNIVWRNDHVAVILNAYPYGTGHVLVMPVRHAGELEQLDDHESSLLWAAINKTVRVIKSVYGAPGLNVGFNLGAAAGAGIPAHLHAHVLPRWNADTNFMASVANTRVLPEALSETWEKIHNAWPEA